MNTIVEIYSIATLAILSATIGLMGLYIANRFGRDEKIWKRIDPYINSYWKESSFALALLATVGSLYMSNFLGWEPCRLCWFQRILMYPLAVLFGISWLLDTDVSEYAIPIATIGGGIAGYHYLIQRMEQFQSAGCSITSVSCETEYTFYLGIVTVPFMAFTAFLGILIINWISRESEI